MYGALNVGSATLMPCVRMHFVAATSCTRSRSDSVCGAMGPGSRLVHIWRGRPHARDTGVGAMGPGSRLVHIWRAALYAGQRALMVDAISKPPPALGSGKFGTTCERMHEANLRPGPTGTDAAFVGRARRAAASDGHQAAHGEEDRHEAPVAMQRHERHTQPVTVGR